MSQVENMIVEFYNVERDITWMTRFNSQFNTYDLLEYKNEEYTGWVQPRTVLTYPHSHFSKWVQIEHGPRDEV